MELSQFSSVAHSCPTLCDPMDCRTPGFPVHHQLPELAQTHRTGDILDNSIPHPLITFSLPRHWAKKHPHKYPKYPQGGSTAPFENHRSPTQNWLNPGCPSAWVEACRAQPCSHSLGRNLSPDPWEGKPQRRLQVCDLTPATASWVHRPQALPPRITIVHEGAGKRDLHAPNGLQLLPATLCPAQPSQTGPWAACPGWTQTELSRQLPEATSTARRPETWLLVSVLLRTRCVTWERCLTSPGFMSPSVMRASQNSLFSPWKFLSQGKMDQHRRKMLKGPLEAHRQWGGGQCPARNKMGHFTISTWISYALMTSDWCARKEI